MCVCGRGAVGGVGGGKRLEGLGEGGGWWGAPWRPQCITQIHYI